MKVLPIYLYSNITNPKGKSVVGNMSLPMVENRQNFVSQGDKVELSFKGEGVEYTTLDLSPLKNSSRTHCPVCGVKMLSPDDYNDLVERAGQISTTQDLVELLKENSEYIPKNMKGILDGSNSQEYVDTTPLKYYVLSHMKGATARHKSNVLAMKDYLQSYAKDNFSQDKVEELQNVLSSISEVEYASSIRKKLIPYFASLDISGQEKYDISKNVFPKIAQSSGYLWACKVKNIQNLSPQEVSAKLVANIFKNSVIDFSEIRKNNKTGVPYVNNEIALCSSCKVQGSKTTFYDPYALENPEFKSNMKLYLCDILTQMGANELDLNTPYVKNLCYWIDVLSAHKVKFSEGEQVKIFKCLSAARRHEYFAPIDQAKVDIPCAECGSTLLPHEVHIKILKELKQYNTPSGYANVLKKYDKYIGDYARPTAEIFLRIVEDSPNITSEELATKLNAIMVEVTKRNVKRATYQFQNQINYVQDGYKDTMIPIISSLSDKVLDYIDSGKFDDVSYNNLHKECFLDILSNKGNPNSLFVFMRKVKRFCYMNNLSKVTDLDRAVDKDPAYTIMYNIFKTSIATADHIVPHNSGGSGDKENLIALCKPCNALKTKKSPYSWYVQNSHIRHHLYDQLKVIDEMSKSGALDGYDSWASSVAASMYELTNKKFDVREEFSKN